MSVDMWNCHSWPLDISNNLSEYFMSNSVHMHLNNFEQWRGHSVVCQMWLGGPSAFGYHEQDWTVKRSLCCLLNVTGGGYIITFTWVKLTFPYMFLLVDFSLYFPISWLFWMGSHWSHWTAKSSLCPLAVSNGGVYCKFYLGKTDFSLYFPIS